MCKFSAFAFAYQDAYNYSKNNESISENQKKYMIKEFSILEYFSYIFFVSTSIMGPFFEFKDFIDFIYLRENYSKIPSSIIPAIQRLATGFMWYGFYSYLSGFGNPKNLIDAKNEFTFYQKVFFFVCGLSQEWKYLGGFCLAESGIIACGLSYNSEKQDVVIKAERWDKIKSISIRKLMSVNRVTTFFHYWNMSIHSFLKKYVYLRVISYNPKKPQKLMAALITFFCSAIWHGYYPAYFVTFLSFFFMQIIETQVSIFVDKNEDQTSLKYNAGIFLFRLVVLLYLVPYHCLMFVCLDYKVLIDLFKASFGYLMLIKIGLSICLFIYTTVFKKRRKDALKGN
jgi:lysophospholipid acyltransferase